MLICLLNVFLLLSSLNHKKIRKFSIWNAKRKKIKKIYLNFNYAIFLFMFLRKPPDFTMVKSFILCLFCVEDEDEEIGGTFTHLSIIS